MSFEIPETMEHLSEVLKLFATWGWADGQIIAPGYLVEHGEASPDTGYRFNGLNRISPSFTSERIHQFVDLVPLVLGEMLPNRLIFGENVGPSCHALFIGFERLIEAYAKRGYYGEVDFFFDQHQSNYNNSALGTLTLHGGMPKSGYRPSKRSSLTVGYDVAYGGAASTICPIVDACIAYGWQLASELAA